MEATTHALVELIDFTATATSSVCTSGYEHRSELAWLVAGAVLWMITEPLRGIGTRLSLEVSKFALKWDRLVKLCVRRYCRYVRGPAVQGRPFRAKLWKMYEALLATPMVVLEARMVHGDGLGRLIYKWADALYEYWCVFLPESWAYAWHPTAKYYDGAHVESHRTVARARLLWQLVWTFGPLLAYAAFFGTLFLYELLKWMCRGLPGIMVLMLSVNYAVAADGGETVSKKLSANFSLAIVDGLVFLVCLVSRLRKRYESDAGGRTLLEVAKMSYAAWCLALEEHEQAVRLSEAFWRMDGCEDRPRAPVRTRSGLQAERRALRARREAECVADPRRGRRASVGEDVPSWNGGRRLGTVDRSEPRFAPAYPRSEEWEEDGLWYGAV